MGIDKIMGQYLIRTYYPHDTDKFEWHEPPLRVESQYLMFSKKTAGYRQKLADFNRDLQQISESGKIEAIVAKHENYRAHPILRAPSQSLSKK